MNHFSTIYIRIQILLLFCFFSSLFGQNSWVIEAENIDPKHYTGISVSNGMIGVVSSPEPMKVSQTILAGVYDQYGRGRTSNFLSGFNLLDLNLTIDGTPVNLDNISNYKQKLDMKKASFAGSFDYKDIATVQYSYIAIRNLPNNVMLNVSIKAKKNITFRAENLLKLPPGFKDNQQFYTEITPPHAKIPLLTSLAKSPTGSITMAASSTFVFPEKHGEQPEIKHNKKDNEEHTMGFSRELQASQTYTFSLVGTLISSAQVKDPLNYAERLSIYAGLQGIETIKTKHEAEWQKLWEGDIQIEGDPQVQQDVHNMLYHLYSFSREGSDTSLSPVGLSGVGYNGHVFWDTELFMFKPLLFFKPEIAKSLVGYRFNRLKAAEENARIYGYKGAMYPWESAVSGEEETPVWALTGTYEHHITGDVAFAAWHYYLFTKDVQWLKEKGWPILEKTAEFWESRVEKKNGKYHILNVVAADEWAENVDNNAYTNAIAKLNFEYANEAAKILKLPVNKNWENIADKLIFSKLENGVTREHDSYTGQKIKQADVNLLAYPLGIIDSKEQILKDLLYYQEKVPQEKTPAMTKSIFALLHSKLGNGKEAYKWFKESYEYNLLPPFRVLAETAEGDNPYFITGAGGTLQAVIMGFAGVDFGTDGKIIQAKNALPPHWKKITVKGIGMQKQTFSNPSLR
ncbi:glycosyl hydrolase family 65 [Elizabethkingia anophelis]|uniref:glycosyl hydrolase family 95 catalytic domain-containing protein n=1 Tax=Elizabethkingia anophelis TaxID=1117645 RepID=UPI0021A751D6|nr:glycoside hydrolase family 65 protein [Elizabethkingia anophelis]MCT3873908.1 glycoside hydrolase family 65 protein [Elizabethkingia anophelis]MDV3849225.1 glycosyl hydrolase family 65 [Elizabethkingia anophelis]